MKLAYTFTKKKESKPTKPTKSNHEKKYKILPYRFILVKDRNIRLNNQPKIIVPTIATIKGCLIGINYYNTRDRLYGCEKDVDTIKNVLVDQLYYKASEIAVLTEQLVIKPTRLNILCQLTHMLHHSKYNDIQFLMFSGHGLTIPDKSGDEDDGMDEIVITCDKSFIVDDEFRQVINQFMKPNTTLFCIFDNCHSGSILDLRYEYYLDSKDEITIKTNEQYVETPGNVILLSSCSDSEKSLEIKDKDGNAFSILPYVFSNYINNQNSKKKVINVLEILKLMKSVCSKYGFTQTCHLSSGKKLNISEYEISF